MGRFSDAVAQFLLLLPDVPFTFTRLFQTYRDDSINRLGEHGRTIPDTPASRTWLAPLVTREWIEHMRLVNE